MIAIIDYGMGNLRSVQKALEHVGADARVTDSPEEILRAGKVVLPGVGAIRPAMEKLDSLGLTDVIKEVLFQGKPFLGICLGLQLLFEKSTEGEGSKGLSVFPGSVERFTELKVPQMGWNRIHAARQGCPLLEGIDDGAFVYFCHSYYVRPQEETLAATITDYGIRYVSSVFAKNVFAVQFHPEKSQTVGLKILDNFNRWAP